MKVDAGNPENQHRHMETILEKTVILWGQDDVLTRAVETLLDTRNGWRVIRVVDDLNESALLQTMEQVTPDVVIVHEGAFEGNVRLLIRFVQDFPQLKIITIGLESNKMDIYNKRTVCIEKPSDFLAAIKNGISP